MLQSERGSGGLEKVVHFQVYKPIKASDTDFMLNRTSQPLFSSNVFECMAFRKY